MTSRDSSSLKFSDEDLGSEEVQIIVKGRKSGRDVSLPVWFVTETSHRKLFLLPMYGSRSQWYRNLVKSPTIQISFGKNSATVQAKPVRNKKFVKDIADRFRKKYGDDQVEKYYSEINRCVEVPLTTNS